MKGRTALAAAGLALACCSPASTRISFDQDWKFALGHAQDAVRDFGFSQGSMSAFSKAGTDDGPIGLGFRDDRWQKVTLPHDWVVGLPFDPKSDVSHGCKPVGRAYPENSIGWYRRAFTAPAAWKDGRVRLHFDGIYRDCMVWINGHWVGANASGTMGFTVDLTDYLRLGSRNVVAVRVNASDFEGWYYEGAGIYRHSWLVVSPSVHLVDDGVVLRPSVETGMGRVEASAEIANETGQAVTRVLKVALRDASGKVVAQAQGLPVSVPPYGQAEAKAAIKAVKASLWSLENPVLYKASASIEGDEQTHSIGFRTVKFDAAKGLILNGKPIKIKGFCCHQDHAGLGVAVPDSINEWRIAQIKKIGANALRTSHQAPSPEVLDACDRLGILVLDETRMFGSTGEALSILARLVRRDRNHPSVFFYSLGNEEWATQSTEESVRIARTMKRVVASLDPTRPVTLAANNGSELRGVNSVVDVRGLNYSIASADIYHKARPNQPFHFSEIASTVTTRGEYADDPAKAYVNSYDRQAVGWGTSSEDWWRATLARDWLEGGFVWTGFDYRGEPTPYGWPNVSSHFGVLDTCGFPKDLAFYYKAWWGSEPVLHVFPNWNPEGKKEGEPVRVWCFTNSDEVELFLNGASQGRRKIVKGGHGEWLVPFHPGELKAVAYRGGVKAQETTVAATGAPARLVLSADRDRMASDGADALPVEVKVVDSEGRVVPGASQKVSFSVTGPGRIIGVGNGDPSCHEPDQLPATQEALSLVEWRMKALDGAQPPQALSGFDQWARVSLRRPQIHTENARAAFWIRFQVEDPSKWVSLELGSVDDRGEVYLNGALLGRTNDWASPWSFPLKGLKKGSNELLVLVQNEGGMGGLTGGASLVGRVQEPAWSRSVFHGLAQAIVQSQGGPGAVTVRAEAEGLAPAELVLTAGSRKGR